VLGGKVGMRPFPRFPILFSCRPRPNILRKRASHPKLVLDQMMTVQMKFEVSGHSRFAAMAGRFCAFVLRKN
jgi:hypothetical protein